MSVFSAAPAPPVTPILTPFSPAPARTTALGNLSAILWDAAAARGADLAIVARDRRWSYGELRARASAIAEHLAASGIERGDRVAIFLDRGGDAAASIFAIHAIGAIGVVISERFRPRQVEYVLTHSGARALLKSSQLLERQPRPIETTAALIDVNTIGIDGSVVPVSCADADIAQILYTSGSTGMPKGVAFRHASLLSGVATVAGYLGLVAEDRIASLLPFSSVYGLNQLLSAVQVGATLVVENSPLPIQIVERLRDERVTVAAAVPPLWLQLIGVPSFIAEPIATLRIIQNAGGHCPRDAVRQLRAAQPGASIFLQYGMTETFRSTFLSPAYIDERPDSMGRPMPGVEILVVADDGSPCAAGEIGELVHSGPTIASGYWADPEGTARVFRPHPCATERVGATRVVYSGDMVRRDAEGFLYFVSRRDRMIKSLGFRIGPDEIVDVLFASGAIGEAVIMTEPDAQRGERIIAYVALKENGSLTALRQFCRTELPRHMQPARIELRASLARLPSGKYDLETIRTDPSPP